MKLKNEYESCGLNAERRGNLHVTEGMDYRDAWGWIGIGSSGRRHEGIPFHHKHR